MSKYLLNCFSLLLPVLLWNIAFMDKLPKGYLSTAIWDKIPSWLNVTENILRAMVFLLPLFLKLSLESKIQKIGLIVYLLGLIIYYASWIWPIYFPNSNWSNSLIGYMAPAYTTIVFFTGIALIGQQSFLNIPRIGLIYFILSIAFVIVHSYHAYLAYKNLELYNEG